jgi:dihydroorotate dehydrogenase
MKKSLLFILFLLCTTLTVQAQPERGKFNPEEFRAKLEEFITRKADFTNTEAQTFFPIFHKMKEEQRTLQTEMFKLKRNRSEENNLSEKDYANKIQRICELNTKMAEIQESYYKKMYKAVPAQKVYKAMLAEDAFHRMMLRQFDQRRRDNHRKK